MSGKEIIEISVMKKEEDGMLIIKKRLETVYYKVHMV